MIMPTLPLLPTLHELHQMTVLARGGELPGGFLSPLPHYSPPWDGSGSSSSISPSTTPRAGSGSNPSTPGSAASKPGWIS